MRTPPSPPVGHVIAYEYLWSSQQSDRDDGSKTYPCAVIMGVDIGTPHPIAYVLGISHSPPRRDQRAVEMPRKLRRHLGLDDQPAWVYVDQLNIFTWPGPDLRPGERLSSRPDAKGTCVIGALPVDWFEMLKGEVVESRRLAQLRAAKRTS